MDGIAVAAIRFGLIAVPIAGWVWFARQRLRLLDEPLPLLRRAFWLGCAVPLAAVVLESPLLLLLLSPAGELTSSPLLALAIPIAGASEEVVLCALLDGDVTAE